MAVITTTSDSWVNQDATGTNYGDGAKLNVRGSGTSHQRFAYMHFKRTFPLGATILSATLKMYIAGTWSGTNSLTAKRVTTAWAESRINWNNKPTVVGGNAATEVGAGTTDGSIRSFDVTAMMQDVSDGGAYFGIRMEIAQDQLRSFHSAEYSDPTYRPVLEIEWSVPPEAPTNLTPSDSRAVSKEYPLLRWKFADDDLDTQASSQVQVSTSSSFAAPAYDSTKVANTLSEWDLDTLYSVADDDTRYWRVMVWDDTDLASDWSDTAIFQRKTQGTLALSDPGATVAETSPEVAWTLTGRTQESYEVVLYRVPATGDPTQLWTSGKVTSTDVSINLPNGYVRSGFTYRVRLRVWDTIDRQSMAGDPDYTEDSQDFTYSRDGSPTAVPTITATPNEAGVDLVWTRAAEPDFFCLVVDGEEVMDRIDPADVFVSGTTYAMTYWGATPRQSHTYEMEGVVITGGVHLHSDGNDTDTATTTPTGIWLADPEDDTAVMIEGRDAAGLVIGESGTTYSLLGRRSPVRITDSVRGYEGSISGSLADADARDDFLDLKGRMNELRLIVGDLNIPVRLEEVAVVPSPVGVDQLYPVSFTVFQTDEFFSVIGL